MIGRLYIDGKDAYLEYGVFVTQGGWNELLSMPPLKAVESNDWQEEDGVEADLATPVLDTREVQIKFAASGLYASLPALLEELSDGAYHTFQCTSIGRTFKLRLVSDGARSMAPSLDLATLKFADDFPLRNYAYEEPESSVEEDDSYTIDGKPFTDYGVRILKGTLLEVKKKPNVKPNLLRNIKTQSGAIYDDERVTFKTKDVNLTCLLRATTLTELWQNYNALLYDLIRAHEHVFRVSELWSLFYCYYKKCSVNEFYPTDKIWLKFTLTLTFVCRVPSSDIEEAFGLAEITDTSIDAETRRDRIADAITEDEIPLFSGSSADIENAFILATEDDGAVLTETDESFIDLRQ